ncbi:MAG: hypothetical protein ACI8O8_000044 [Oleiphilaceae bacterium]|jgi:hypothetical protein
MLTIRDEQASAFSQMKRKEFARSMIPHLKKFVPVACSTLADEALFAAIDHGVEQAKHCGFVTQQAACKYITLMFILGLDFNTDPQLTWTKKLLDPQSERHAEFRIDDLFAETIERLRENPKLKVQNLQAIQPNAR